MNTVSIAGGETLLGRELNDRLKDVRPGDTIELLGAGESGAVLTEVEGEATVLTPIDTEHIHDSDLIFCAGDVASTRRVQELAAASTPPPTIIDLTSALEELPSARLRSPFGEAVSEKLERGGLYVVAHPAASVLAAVLLRIHSAHPIRYAVVLVFEPVSERGQAGLTELQQQVGSLLSFRKLDKRVFDAQIGFNLLPRYGEDAPEKLESIEARIQRHLASLLASQAPMPSLRLVQAPVFHGHSLSIWIEFDVRPSVAVLGEALATASIEVRGADVDAPTNVGAAGQSGVTVGVIEPDLNHPRAMWLWAVADNYRVMADNAVELARTVLEEDED